MPSTEHTLAIQGILADCQISPPYSMDQVKQFASMLHPDVAYHGLHAHTWGSKQPPFVEEDVLRDEDNRARVEVPKKTWAFRPSPEIQRCIFQRLRTRAFVREEYMQALSDIIEAVRTGNAKITVGDEDEPEEDPGKEKHTDRASSDPSSTSGKHVREEGSDVGDRERKKQCLQDTGTSSDVGDEVLSINRLGDKAPAVYSNPFVGNKELAPKIKGFIIMGHPGIGKTIFLYYVLLLRMQASQPTILVTHPERVVVFLRHGTFSMSMADFDAAWQVLPTDAWCLLDCNDTMEKVPESIFNTPFFIIQAASPRRNHLHWQNKAIGVHVYVMRPFSLSELIIGRYRSLDTNEIFSEDSLSQYHNHFTPSARFAYQHANDLEKYSKIVGVDISKLTFAFLKRLVDAGPAADYLDEHVSHHVFAITVETGALRNDAKNHLPSRHTSQLLMRHLRTVSTLVAAELYYIFRQTPFTRASAGYILDHAMHDVLLHCSRWPVKTLAARAPSHPRERNYHWVLDADAPRQTLVLSKDGVTLSPRDVETEREMKLDTHLSLHYLPKRGDEKQRQEFEHNPTMYFRSMDPNEATFDAVIFDEVSTGPEDNPNQKLRAVIFQATVSKVHTAKARGFSYLEGLGVEEIWYVAVVPPGHAIDILVAEEWNAKTTVKLQLEIGDEDIAALVDAALPAQ